MAVFSAGTIIAAGIGFGVGSYYQFGWIGMLLCVLAVLFIDVIFHWWMNIPNALTYYVGLQGRPVSWMPYPGQSASVSVPVVTVPVAVSVATPATTAAASSERFADYDMAQAMTGY